MGRGVRALRARAYQPSTDGPLTGQTRRCNHAVDRWIGADNTAVYPTSTKHSPNTEYVCSRNNIYKAQEPTLQIEIILLPTLEGEPMTTPTPGNINEKNRPRHSQRSQPAPHSSGVGCIHTRTKT